MPPVNSVGEDVDQLRREPIDPFLPLVLLQPIIGVPQNFDAADGTGQRFTLTSLDRLQSFQFTDSDRKRDFTTITFIDDEGVFVDPNRLAHGGVLDVAWGYRGKMSAPRRMVVRRLKVGLVQGRRWAKKRRGFLVTIEAMDMLVTHHNRAPNGDDLYENKPLETIVRTVAEKMGYHEGRRDDHRLRINLPKSMSFVEAAIARPAATTYPQFLQELADRYGFILRQNGQGLYFGIREEENTADYLVDLNGSTLLGFDLDGDLVLGAPAAMKAVGYNPATSEIKEVRKTFRDAGKKTGKTTQIATSTEDLAADGASTGAVEDVVHGAVLMKEFNLRGSSTKVLQNRQMEDFRTAPFSQVDAKIVRDFLEKVKRTWKLRMKLVGDPEIVAGRTIYLQNFDTPLLDGVWYIKESRHTIDQQGFVTELIMHRVTGPNALTGTSVLVNARKSARTKEDKDSVYDESGQVQGGALLGQSANFSKALAGGKAKRSHRTEGTYSEFDIRRRGR